MSKRPTQAPTKPHLDSDPPHGPRLTFSGRLDIVEENAIQGFRTYRMRLSEEQRNDLNTGLTREQFAEIFAPKRA